MRAWGGTVLIIPLIDGQVQRNVGTKDELLVS